MNFEKNETIKKLELFKQVKPETIEKFLEVIQVNYYQKSSYIFRDKDKLESVYILLSGKVNLYKLSENGQKRIVFILDKGHILNDDLTQNLQSAISCVAFEESLVMICPKIQFEKLLAYDYELMKAVLEQYTKKLRRTYRQLKNVPTNLAIEKKLATKLWKLGKDYGLETSEGVLIDLPLSVMYISQLLGSQRETVSRAIKKLVELDLVKYENKKWLLSIKMHWLNILNREYLSKKMKKCDIYHIK